MFGSSNPFGQSSAPLFGQPNGTAGSNPFAPKPFGSPNPFGAQTGSPAFGTSTGVFGASSASAFGSSTPSFGASSTPAFGSSSSSLGSSAFGQKPAFGGFGSTTNQPSPFGSTSQQTQPALGSNLFGSTTPFGASSQPVFGATSNPAFGATSTPAFGATSTPAFGATSTPSFGATSAPAFGSTSTTLFGSTGAAFGVSSTPTFGSTGTSAFGAPSSSLFGSSSTPAFGASSSPAFGSSPSFGQSASTFGSTPFGTTPSAFGSQSSPFGAQTAAPTFGSPGFGQSGFGSQQGGSRVVPYSATPDTETSGTQPAGRLESISAMPAYKEKSHEELRWEDYQRGDKGGPNPSGHPAGGISFPTPTQANPFGSTGTFGQPAATGTFGQPAATGTFGQPAATGTFGQPAATGTFGQPAANSFSAASSSNPFASKTSAFGSTGFGSSSTSLFTSSSGTSTSSPFGSTSITAPFGVSSNAGFGSSSSSSLFGGTTTSAFSSQPSIFGSSMAGSNPSFSSGPTFGNTQSSGLFQSSTPSIVQTSSPFGQPTGFQQTTPALGSNLLSTPSTGFGGSLFTSSAPSVIPSIPPVGIGQTTPSLSTPFASTQAPSIFSFNNFGQTQQASSGFCGVSNFSQSTLFGQPLAPQTNMVMQPTTVTNPFGTLPAVPQMSISCVGSAPSVQYGISTMPVSEKPTPVRISSLVTPRHLSQRRIRLPARKYHPKVDGQRVPYFVNDDSSTATPTADALFIPRENPRDLIIRPIAQWPLRAAMEKQSMRIDNHVIANGNGNASEPSAAVQNETSGDQDESPRENGHTAEQDNKPHSPSTFRASQKTNGNSQDNHAHREDSSYIPISGHRAGKAAIVYEHGAGIEALMPKLRNDEYYTEPCMQELAAKERDDPGFCRRVKDFVVGRHGYGSIKFLGETDVRRLDLESIVLFNNREVVVYKDEGKKPPVGQGLNKAAEVTLLNIKCMNKKTGQQYTEGPKVERYKEMLIKKTEEQGAEFLLYDAVKGEWRFGVKHFSSYELGDGDLDIVECCEHGSGDSDVSFSGKNL